jgi:hypothetical protein
MSPRNDHGDDWPLVRTVMAALSGEGIWQANLKPGRITLR